MLTRLAASFARAFRVAAPDPFVLAIILSLVVFALGIALADQSAAQMLAHWKGGLWSLLAFGMQMCLILVTGHALASAPIVSRALHALARIPKTPRQAVWLTSFLAIGASLLNWGLGLIVGSLLARDLARTMRARGRPTSPAILAAAGFTCMMTWHGGLSGSAPLKVASMKDQVELLGADLAGRVGVIPVSETVFSPMNIAVTLTLWALVPLLMACMCPRLGVAIGDAHERASASPIEPDPNAYSPSEPAHTAHTGAPGPLRLIDRVNSGPVFAWLLALPALWVLFRHFFPALDASGARPARGGVTFDMMNLAFFAIGLLLHASPARYVRAVEHAVHGCAGIIIQFPLYAGIVGMLDRSGLVAMMAGWYVDIAGKSESKLAVGTFLSAGLVNVFVPSGGGQWAVQGRIVLQAASEAGAQPGKMVMAVAYGDQWTNMIQFFWMPVVTGVTGVKAQDALGYTAVTLLLVGPLFALALAVM